MTSARVALCLAALGGALRSATAAAPAPPKYHIGRPATPDELRARDITVFPAGAGLPPGRGTAREGRPLYMARCASCHGPQGTGMGEEYPPVAGGLGTLKTARPLPTVGSYWPYATTVWDYIRRSMPYDRTGTLSDDQVYAVTAFVLHLNRLVGEDDVVSRETLPKVKMPNRDGFVPDPRPDVKSKR